MTETIIMKPIVLADKELSVLRRCFEGTFNAITATIEEQDIEIALIEMASKFEEENDLIDERMEYSQDCNLLKWFYYRYQLQQKGGDA
jgi:hypothetical protein